MSSSFTYGSNDFVSAMNTPYGSTLFETGRGPVANDSLNLYVQATDAFGTERVEFRNHAVSAFAQNDAWNNALSAATPPVPDLNTRLSFYWDKNAWKQAPGDVTKARVYQFLHGPSVGNSSGVPAYTKNALEGRVMYRYPAQTQPFFTFSGAASAQPSAILLLLEDAKTQQTTLVESNNFGHITKSTDPAGRQVAYTYADNQIDLIQVTNLNSSEVLAQISYDGRHLPTSYTDAAGQTSSFTYNAAGQILSATDAQGNTSTFAYNPDGYLISVTGPLPDAITRFTYDGFGRVQTITNSDGYTLAYSYDAMDRVTQVIYPDQTFDQTTYDKLDPVAFTDRQGRVTRTAYDSLRRPVSVTDPLGQVTRYGWCNCGGLASITDPKGNTTTWNRDVQGRAVSKMLADGSSIQYSYDAMTGRLSRVTDAKGQVTSYSYFPDGNAKQIAFSGGAPTAPVTFTYDPNVNRVTSFTDGTGTTSYSYLPAGALGAYQPGSVTGPRGEQITYGYDELGRTLTRRHQNLACRSTASTFHADPFCILCISNVHLRKTIRSDLAHGRRW